MARAVCFGNFRNRLCLLSDQAAQRGKKKQDYFSEASQNTPNPELIQCVAKSWKWYQALSKGKVRSLQQLAAQEKTSVETVTRNLPLANLNPDQIEKLLTGHHAADLSVAKLLADPSLI